VPPRRDRLPDDGVGSLVGLGRATWHELTAGLDDPDLALPTGTEVAYAVRRIFAAAHMKSHWARSGRAPW
jgi:hypothetical protein